MTTRIRLGSSEPFAQAADFGSNAVAGRVLTAVAVPGGLDTQWTDLNPGLAPSINHTVYVQKGGSDVTGDGSWGKPYATINQACTLIRALGNASSAHRYAVFVGPGSYVETLTISEWTYIVGSSIEGTRVTFTSFGFGPEWTALADHRSGLQHMTVSGAPTIDFATVNSQQGKLRWDDVVFNDTFNYVAFNAINQISCCRCTFLGGWTQTGINFSCFNCSSVNGGAVVVTATTINAVVGVMGSGFDGALTVNATGVPTAMVEMAGSSFEGLLTLNGANASIVATSNPLAFSGGVSLLAGATDPRKSLTGAKAGNAALASVCTQLAATGAFVDNTT